MINRAFFCAKTKFSAKEGKKKFARMEQTLNKHEDIKRESIKSFLK